MLDGCYDGPASALKANWGEWLGGGLAPKVRLIALGTFRVAGGAMDGPKSYRAIWFGTIHGPGPCEFIRSYEFIWFEAIDGPKPYDFMGDYFMGNYG